MIGWSLQYLFAIIIMSSLIEVVRHDIGRTWIVYAQVMPLLPGVKITSHTQAEHVPAWILPIFGISTDNSTSICDVYIILNGIRPYQKVYATGSDETGNDDYTTWSYTFTPEYATIQEGNNRMTSKITCIDQSGNNSSNHNLTKFNSLNVTGIKRPSDALPAIATTTNSVNSDPLLSTTNSTSSSAFPTNITYAATIGTVQDGEDSIYGGPDNTALTPAQNADMEDEEQIELPDDHDNNNWKEYENEVDFSIEELYDRVYDQVTEQLREAGIEFPP